MRSMILVPFVAFAAPAIAASVDFEPLPTANYPSPPGLTIGGFTFTATSTGSDPTVRIFDDAVRSSYVLACDFAFDPGRPCEQTLDILFPSATDSFALDLLAYDDIGSTATFVFDTAGGPDVRTFVRPGVEDRPRAVFFGLADATGVSISSDDAAGLGYDDIETDLPPIPLPATGALLIGALGAAAAMRRRAR